MVGHGGHPVYGAQDTTIFSVMNALAARHGAINLGQGFPDEDGPAAIRAAAARALLDGPNQYAPLTGMAVLRKAVAAHAKRFYDLDLDAGCEILVTAGGTEALAASLTGLIAPGDEAVIVEPAYDSYRPVLEAAGAQVKAVRLEAPSFKLEEAALAAAFSPRTKLVVVNGPLNPVGRVFGFAELEMLAGFIKRNDAFAVCDEVYEHLVFDGAAHIPLMTLPGMFERCLRIGSAGKIFSLTGWKIGWVAGPAPLIAAVTKVHQFLTFTVSPALQIGIAHGLEHEMDFTLSLTHALQKKRDRLAGIMAPLGFEALPCEGTCFLTARTGDLTGEPDRAFCERLAREARVALIPLSPFYGTDGPTDLVRFAFCKNPENLGDAITRLENYFLPAAAKRIMGK